MPIALAFGSTAVYVHDESRDSTSPVDIECLYGDRSLWAVTDAEVGLPSTPFFLEGPFSLSNGTRLDFDVEDATILTVSPAPMSVFTLSCDYDGGTEVPPATIEILVIPGSFH